ncbi:MAG: S-layer family protein, partial [Alphaproteobacteria bacterium]|nr:S-layer family protein [Alphaproteobacteria bacterium]
TGALSLEAFAGGANVANLQLQTAGTLGMNAAVNVAGNVNLTGTTGVVLAYNVNTSAAGNVAVNGAATLADNVTVNVASGNIAFNSTIDAAASGVQSLTLAAGGTGNLTFGGGIGAATRLASLTASAGGATTLNQAVNTTGNVAFTIAGAMTMTGAAAVNATGGNFSATVTGAGNDFTQQAGSTIATNGGNVTVGAVGNATLSGSVATGGGAFAATLTGAGSQFQQAATSAITTNGGSATVGAAGNATFAGSVATTGGNFSTTLTGAGSDFVLQAGATVATGAGNVTVASVGNATFAGGVATTGGAFSATASGAGSDILQQATSSIATANGDVTITATGSAASDFAQQVGATIDAGTGRIAVAVGGNATVASLATANTSTTAGAEALRVVAGDRIAAVGGATHVNAAAGRAYFQSAAGIGNTTLPLRTDLAELAVNLTGTGQIGVNDLGSFVLASYNGSGANAVQMQAAATLDVASAINVTSGTTLVNLTAASIVLGADVRTTGAIEVNGPTVVNAAAVSVNSTGTGAVNFAAAIQGAAAGSNALTVTAADGNIAFAGAVGGTTELASLSATANGAGRGVDFAAASAVNVATGLTIVSNQTFVLDHVVTTSNATGAAVVVNVTNGAITSAGGSINTMGAADALALQATDLGSAGAIALTGFETVAANATAGSVNLTHTGTGALTVATVGGVTGLRSAGTGNVTLTSNQTIHVGAAVTASGTGDVLLTSTGGGVNVSAAVTSSDAASNVAITTAPLGIFSMAAGGSVAAGGTSGNATITADDFDLQGSTVSAANVRVRTVTAGRTLGIGSGTGAAAVIDDAEAAKLLPTAGGTLFVGDAANGGVTGNITVNTTHTFARAIQFDSRAADNTTTVLGTLATSGQNVTFLDNVSVNSTTTTIATAGGNLTFAAAGQVNPGAAGNTLVLNMGGGRVDGFINAAAGGALNVNVSSAAILDANVTTNGGNFTTTGAVTLAQAVDLVTGGGNVTFGAALDGAQALTVAAGGGNVAFNGGVGATTALASINVTSGAGVSFGSSALNVTGNINTTNIGVTLASGIAGTGQGITIGTGTGAIDVQGDMGTSGARLGSVALTSTGVITVRSAFTTGAQTYAGNVNIASATTTFDAGGLVNVTGNLDAVTGGAQALVVNAGSVTFGGDLGAARRLASLAITAGSVSLGNSATTGDVFTVGNQVYSGGTIDFWGDLVTAGNKANGTGTITLNSSATLRDSVVMTSMNRTDGNITGAGATTGTDVVLNGSIDAAASGVQSLTVFTGGGNITVNNDVGATTALLDITLQAVSGDLNVTPLIHVASVTMNSTNNQTYRTLGPVSAGFITFDNTSFNYGSNLTIESIALLNGDQTFGPNTSIFAVGTNPTDSANGIFYNVTFQGGAASTISGVPGVGIGGGFGNLDLRVGSVTLDPGATVIIGNNAPISAMGNVTLGNGANLAMSGGIKTVGDVVVNGAANGTTAISVGGLIQAANLTIANVAAPTLSGGGTFNGTGGINVTGAQNVTMLGSWTSGGDVFIESAAAAPTYGAITLGTLSATGNITLYAGDTNITDTLPGKGSIDFTQLTTGKKMILGGIATGQVDAGQLFVNGTASTLTGTVGGLTGAQAAFQVQVRHPTGGHMFNNCSVPTTSCGGLSYTSLNPQLAGAELLGVSFDAKSPYTIQGGAGLHRNDEEEQREFSNTGNEQLW